MKTIGKDIDSLAHSTRINAAIIAGQDTRYLRKGTLPAQDDANHTITRQIETTELALRDLENFLDPGVYAAMMVEVLDAMGPEEDDEGQNEMDVDLDEVERQIKQEEDEKERERRTRARGQDFFLSLPPLFFLAIKGAAFAVLWMGARPLPWFLFPCKTW